MKRYQPSLLLVQSSMLLGLLGSVADAKPEQIRTVQDPIYHLYLQAHPDNSEVDILSSNSHKRKYSRALLTTPVGATWAASMPVLGPEVSSEYFDIDGTIQSTNTSLYLSPSTSAATSYKPLSLDSTASFSSWTLEGDTIITATTSQFGRQLNFLACVLDGDDDYWDIYLQTGSDVPEGRECSNYQTMHLPCLC